MKLNVNWRVLFEPLYQWLTRYMRATGLILYGKDDGPSVPSPNYEWMKTASDEAAKLGETLGTAQIDEARKQYDLNRAISDPVVRAQLGLMTDSMAQGKDYYEYGKRGRDIEEAIRSDVLTDTTARDQTERDLITGGDVGIYDARRGDIEWGVDRAVADARQGLTNQYNQLLRQGLRYGYSPQAMAARFGPQATQAGLGVASAANTARLGGINRSRGLLAQGREMRIQDDTLRFGRRMDAAGLYKPYIGASQSAYGLGLGAGSSALATGMAPGSALMHGMAQGAGMKQTGMGQKLTGLGSILNSQTSQNNASMAASGDDGTTGAMIGAAASIAIAI